LLGSWVVVWLSAGCTAIPINLPAVDSGMEYADAGDRLADQGSADSPKSAGAPDAAASLDGSEGVDGDARPDGWLPDACLSDAESDAVCPVPPDGGPLDATEDGMIDAPSPSPDAGSQD
jgi:hypothetical protein